MARAADLSPIRREIWESCRMRVAAGDQRTRPIIGCHKVLESNGASAAALSSPPPPSPPRYEEGLDFDLDHQDSRPFSPSDSDERELTPSGRDRDR